MDSPGSRVPPLTPSARPTIDLHLHSTASDGQLEPAAVVEHAARVGLGAIALTDHDTLDGVAAAQAAGARLGVRVVGGCEFSVLAPWGEMHVLGYFLPPDSAELNAFLERCRADRIRRGRVMVERLQALGIAISFDDVLRMSGGGAVGRPHVARALIAAGAVPDINSAFDRYLGRHRPAFVEKALPGFAEVARIVHAVGGLVSAAHLKDRATRSLLERFRNDGLDAVETRHPSHGPDQRARLTDFANGLGLLRTGGSDWHGETLIDGSHGAIGSQDVPAEWLGALEARVAA